MTDKELKKLKDDLWHSADILRAGAHLAANKYGQPILGLIFLRYADILYKQYKEEIEARYHKLKGTRMENLLKRFPSRFVVSICRRRHITMPSTTLLMMPTRPPL